MMRTQSQLDLELENVQLKIDEINKELETAQTSLYHTMLINQKYGWIARRETLCWVLRPMPIDTKVHFTHRNGDGELKIIEGTVIGSGTIMSVPITHTNQYGEMTTYSVPFSDLTKVD